MTSARCCARSARYNSNSVIGAGGGPAVRMSRRRSSTPSAVPPGSRVSTTVSPRLRSAAPVARSCVDLPAPSPPSKAMRHPGSTNGFPFAENQIDAVEQLLLGVRLGDVVVRAVLVAAEHVVVVRLGGDQDRRR